MKPRVLIVDDEVMIRENLMAYLEDEGMEVIGVASVEAATVALRQCPDIKVCIMDLRLPGQDGHAGIRALNALVPDLEFIIHTGSSNYALPPDLRQLGLDDARVFLKPLNDMAPLARLVRLLCRGTPRP